MSQISSKRAKYEGDNNDVAATTHKSDHKFKGFKISKVLNENIQRNTITVQGTFDDSDMAAIVVVAKTPITAEHAQIYLSDITDSEEIFHNDIYATHSLYPRSRDNAIKTSLIYPATEKHIVKYSSQNVYLINETPEDYKNLTLPYIEKASFDHRWVYNILEKKKESERIVFEDPDPHLGFILLPDMKWDGHQLEDLYLVAIVHQHGIKSLRDLNSSYLPLLKNIHKKSQEAVMERYAVPSSLLRVYVHYQPSYYHLHVHVTHLRFEAPGSGVERGHLLSDVIENIELYSDYYLRKSLTFITKENDELTKIYREAGKL